MKALVINCSPVRTGATAEIVKTVCTELSSRYDTKSICIDPGITAVIFFGFGFLFPDFINAHPTFFAVTGCILLMLSAGFLPILYFILDDRAYKKARATHYGNYLKMLLPQDLECNTALITGVVYEKAEGSWIIDGEESLFGYCSMVNISRFEPQTEVAIVYDGKGFLAIVKRDPRTESFFG